MIMNNKEMMYESYLKTITCQKGGHIHNARTRYTTGYFCRDCGSFIERDSLLYFMTEQVGSIWMAIHNRGVDFRRGNTNMDISEEAKSLMEKLDNKELLNSLTENECLKFKDEAYRVLNQFNIQENEANVIIN